MFKLVKIFIIQQHWCERFLFMQLHKFIYRSLKIVFACKPKKVTKHENIENSAC